MNFRFYAAVFIILAVAGIFAGTRARVLAHTEMVKPQLVDFQKLLKSPQQYKKQAVVFTCRFIKTGELFRQNSSCFTPATHANFMVWPVEAALWDKNVRRQILSSLFVNKKNHEALSTLQNLSRYDTLKIIGVVEESYANLPWINVEKVIIIPGEHLNDAMLQHVARGNELLAQGDKEKAMTCFELAVNKGAPAFIRQYIQTATVSIATANNTVLVEKKVENYMPLVEAAREAARHRDLASAERLYLQAREQCDNNAWLYKEIGLFYEYEYNVSQRIDKLEAAMQAYRKAEILGGRDADMQYLQARVAFLRGKKTGEFNVAENLVERCLLTNSEHALARQLSAEITAQKLQHAPTMVLVQKNEMPIEAQIFTKSATPLTPAQHLQLAKTLLENNNRESALKHLQIAAESNDTCANTARTLLTSLIDTELETVKREVTSSFSEIKQHAELPANLRETLSEALSNENISETIDETFAAMGKKPNATKPKPSAPPANNETTNSFTPEKNIKLEHLPDWAQ